MRAILFILPLLFLLSIAVSSCPAQAARPSGYGRPGKNELIVGDWRPIQDVNDPHIRDIAEFVIAENNKEETVNQSKLMLSKVLSGSYQVVEGIKYRIQLEALAVDTGKVGEYETLVWEKPSENLMQILSFGPIKN